MTGSDGDGMLSTPVLLRAPVPATNTCSLQHQTSRSMLSLAASTKEKEPAEAPPEAGPSSAAAVEPEEKAAFEHFCLQAPPSGEMATQACTHTNINVS